MRAIRQWSIAWATDAGLALARFSPSTAIDQIERLVAMIGPRVPVVGRNVAANMRALGVYSPQAVREYFANLAAHLAGAMHVWRLPDPGTVSQHAQNGDVVPPGSTGRSSEPDLPMPPEPSSASDSEVRRYSKSRTGLDSLLRERIALDESVEPLREMAVRGQGFVLVGPHLCGYLLFLARLNQDVPLTAYMRPTKHTRRRALQERWMRTVGLRRLVDPQSGANPALVMAGAVRGGGVIYLTPDLPRKRADGTPVRFFNREIYLPAGVAAVARRARAPVYFLRARREGKACRLSVQGPFTPPPGDGDRVSSATLMQWFADRFEQFLHDEPGMWYFWADKRWTRVLAGDPRYSRPLAPESGTGRSSKPDLPTPPFTASVAES